MATGHLRVRAWSGPARSMVVTELKRGVKIGRELSERAVQIAQTAHHRGFRPASWYPVASHAAVVKLVYTPSSGGGGRTPVEVRVLSAALPDLVASLRSRCSLPLSSRGLGRRPLTAETGVRIPVAVLQKALRLRGFRRF